MALLFPLSLRKERGCLRGTSAAEKDIECAATSFLRVENTFGTSRSERSKETLRGCPHKHPGWSAGFLFRKTGGYDIS